MDPQDDPIALSARLAQVWIERLRRRGHLPQPITEVEVVRCRQLVDLLTGVDRNVASTVHLADMSRPPSATSREMKSTVLGLNASMDVYERRDLLDMALDEIPFQSLCDEAAVLSSTEKLAFEDALVDCLVRWFKSSYMRWVDSLPCALCTGPTGCTSMASPTPTERNGGANRVELHMCKRESCGAVRRFPRYNNPAMLMKTREGRCGEWANLFTLFLRAIGLRARYIWNKEDHVWNEYFSSFLSRWVHVDSCEAARDKPLLYERGWGKKMSYILGFSIDGPKDVSRAYTTDWTAMSERRTWVSEYEMGRILREVAAMRRADFASEVRARLQSEDEAEDNRLLHGPEVLTQAEPSRQSGARDWTQARGEAGPSSDP